MEEIFILKEPINTISKPTEIFKKIKKFKIDYTQENFILFFLDSKNKVIKSEILFKGGLNACLIDPKTIFRKALKYNANSFIISHNHPSSDLRPSEEDINAFEKLKEGGRILQLNCLDMIIFNKNIFYSLDK